MVLLARELERVGVPVLLTVQVDSVAKPWQHDDIIPDNVAAAANFYQPYGVIHGREQIHAADESKTRIIGNYRFDYHQAPVKCEDHRGLTAPSLLITCRATAIPAFGRRSEPRPPAH